MLEVIDGRDQQTPVYVMRPKVSVGKSEPIEDVRRIIQDVRLRGDEALVELTAQLDGARLERGRLAVDEATIAKATSLVRPELIDALEVMAERLRTTSERQMPSEWFDERPDEMTGELIRPLRRVGIYVPGGRAAYPSSVIMAAIPAQVAGVDEVAVVTPPGPGGEVAEPVLAACAVVGITEVYRIGGAQAIAALAYGTESVRPVEKIVGPGNIYVTLAKRLVQGWVGIDSEAGPTEIAIVADDSVPPDVVAADIVAQAEHGPHGFHVVITWDEAFMERVLAALEIAVARHEKPDDVENALIEGGRMVLVRDVEQALETANALAPEHLELAFRRAGEMLDLVRHAGAVFIGTESPVSVGDYVAGTNHILPSGGSARWASGLGVHDFIKRIYVSRLQRTSLERLAPHVAALAEAEGLHGHARAVDARLGRPS
jgi:histidinol dehydrogenase